MYSYEIRKLSDAEEYYQLLGYRNTLVIINLYPWSSKELLQGVVAELEAAGDDEEKINDILSHATASPIDIRD